MSEIFQLIWAVLINLISIFFGTLVVFGLIFLYILSPNIVSPVIHIFKNLYEKFIYSGLKGIAVISLLATIILNYYNFPVKSSICDGCEPPEEFYLKYYDYTNDGDFTIGKDFIIQNESEFSLLGSRKNPKVNVKYIKTNTNKFTNYPRYYLVNVKSNCNPYKEYLGQCEFYYYYVIDIICYEPYIHLKILQNDLSFFRDYYYFPQQ